MFDVVVVPLLLLLLLSLLSVFAIIVIVAIIVIDVVVKNVKVKVVIYSPQCSTQKTSQLPPCY